MSEPSLTALLPLEAPPAPPPAYWLEGGILLGLGLALGILTRLWRHSAWRHRLRLTGLQHQLNRPDADSRELAAALDRLLRRRLGRPHLDPALPPAAIDPADWQALTTVLTRARFHRAPIPAATLATAFAVAQRLIRHGPA